MNQRSVEERRLSVRAKRVLSIYYRVYKSRRKIVDGGWRLSTTEDMSLGGLSFLSDYAYVNDDIIELHVIMSGMLDIFKGFGKIVRVEQKRSGSYYLVGVKLMTKTPLATRAAKTHAKTADRLKERSVGK